MNDTKAAYKNPKQKKYQKLWWILPIVIALLVLLVFVQVNSVHLSFVDTKVRLDFNIYGQCIDCVGFNKNSVTFADSQRVRFHSKEYAVVEVATQIADAFGGQVNFELDVWVDGFYLSTEKACGDMIQLLQKNGFLAKER